MGGYKGRCRQIDYTLGERLLIRNGAEKNNICGICGRESISSGLFIDALPLE